MKKVIKTIIKIAYKVLRGIYRLLPLPPKTKERIRDLVGRASAKLHISSALIS